MTEPAESADLTAAKAQFLEADRRLRELAQGAVDLTRASVMLKKARMGVASGAESLRDLSDRLSQYVESLAGMTKQLAAVADGVEKGIEEINTARFDRVDQSLEGIRSAMAEFAEFETDNLERLASIRSAIAELAGIESSNRDQLATIQSELARFESGSRDQLAVLHSEIAELAAIESANRERLTIIQSAITGLDEPDGDDQIGLLPGLEKSLVSLAQDIYAKEVTMVDMMAELRRSLRDDFLSGYQRFEEYLETSEPARARESRAIRRLLWLIVGLLGALIVGVIFFGL